MKRVLHKWDTYRIGHKLHQLQKRHDRAIENGYTEKADSYMRRIKELQEKLANIK